MYCILGALGFVVTDSPDINGNYGIMDQRHALKFVQENIQFFGGNPGKVIFLQIGEFPLIHAHSWIHQTLGFKKI